MKIKKSLRQDIFNYAKKKYGAEPEYLWMKFPEYAVLRNGKNKKWFAVIMDVDNGALGIEGGGRTDIMDIKCDRLLIDLLIKKDGFLPAYHMNKNSWVTVLLDGTVSPQEIYPLLDESFAGVDKLKPKK